MSTEFTAIGDLRVTGDYQDSDEVVRAKSVEAALVLLNTRIANQPTTLKTIVDSNAISLIADKIEEALKNTK